MDDKNFYVLIPAHPPYIPEVAKAVHPAPASAPAFFSCVDTFRDLKKSGVVYPYCKLEFVDLLHRKCEDYRWIHEHAKRLVSVYFALICDRELLFAQTREMTTSATTVTYTEYMTNRGQAKQPNRAKLVEDALQKLVETFEISASLDETEISKADFCSMVEAIRTDLCPSKGRSRLIIEYPPGVEKELSLRDQKEPLDVWKFKRNQKLYELAKTFGIPAQDYYQHNISKLGVPEDCWREMVIKWLPILKCNEDITKSLYCNYRPYFLPEQSLKYKQFQEIVQERSKEFIKIWEYTRREVFNNDRELFCELKREEKLEIFLDDCKTLNLPHENLDASKTAGVLFLLRSGAHSLFGGKTIDANARCLPPEQKSLIEAGVSYFDSIRDEMEHCLHYTARNLLSIDNIRIQLDNFEQELPNFAPYVQHEVNGFYNKEALLLAYKKIFFDPVYQKDNLRKELQVAATQKNCSDIPVEKSVEKYPGQFSLEKCVNAWKISLAEYGLMQGLIEQGRKQLREISKNIFNALGDF